MSTINSIDASPIPSPVGPPGWTRRVAASLAASSALATLLGFGGMYSYVSAPVYIALFLGIGGLVLASAALRFKLPWTPLLWPLFGFGVLVFAQWLRGWSVYRGATLTGLLSLAGCGSIFYLARFGFSDEGCLRRLGKGLTLTAGVIAAEAILQYYTANNFIYWTHSATYADPMGPFVYYNHYAGCMDLLVPVAVAAVFARTHPGEEQWLARLRRSIIPLICVVSVILSHSRGGALTLAFEGLLALAALRPRRMRQWRPAAAITALLGALALSGVRWGPLLARFRHIGTDPDVLDRLRVAASCLAIWRDHLWVGAGFNTFSSVYPRYASFDNALQWNYAHNEYAQLLAETGLVGALFGLAFIALLAYSWWRCRAGSDPFRRLRLAMFVGMAGLAVHSVADFQFHAPANALMFFLFAGAAAKAPAPGTGRLRYSTSEGDEAKPMPRRPGRPPVRGGAISMPASSRRVSSNWVFPGVAASSHFGSAQRDHQTEGWHRDALPPKGRTRLAVETGPRWDSRLDS